MKKALFFLFIYGAQILLLQSNSESIEVLLPSLRGQEKIKALQQLADDAGKIPLEKRLAYGEQALKLSIETNDDELHTGSLISMGNIYQELGNYNKALEYFQVALKISERMQDQDSISISLNKVGLMYRRLNRYELALAFLSRLLEMKEKLGDKKGIAAALNNIALLYKSINDYDKALEYHLESLKIKEELGDKKGLSAALNNIALIYRHQGRYQEALNFLLRSLKIKEELGEQGSIAICLNNIGLIYKSLSRYDSAMEYLVRSLTIKESLGDKKGMSNSLNNIGLIYIKLEDDDKALGYFQRALRITEEAGNKQGQSSCLNNIGLMYYNLGNYDKALVYHQRSREINESLRNKRGIAKSLNNMGEAYRDKKEYERALEYHQEALKINEEIQEKEGLSDSLKDIGLIYLRLNKYEQAIGYFLRAMELKRDMGDRYGTADILLSLGDSYMKMRQLNKALPYIQASLKTAREIQAKDRIKDCYKALSELYQEKGDFRRALEYLKLYGTVKDSIITRASSNKIAKLRARLEAETAKREKEIEILKRDNAIKDLKLNRQKLVRRTYKIAFLFLALLILVILNMYRIKSKAGKQLRAALERTVHETEERSKVEKEKQQLQEQLFHSQKMESIDRLAGGIAHEFNNLLTSIMGYAEMLKEKYKDETELEGRAADIICRNSSIAQELTRRLLGFARSGKYNPVPLNLNDVIRETLSVSGKIFEKNIKTNYDLDIHIHSVDADKNQIIQVLTNLIINAKDAMPGGGEITFKTENVFIDNTPDSLYPGIIEPGHYVKLSVSDTGIGMTEEIKECIFEPFFTTKQKSKGTGLGLAAVYGIIKNHKGYIFCQSEPNKGAAFTIYLPFGEQEGVKEKAEVKSTVGTGTILVVDDEQSVLSLSKDMLERLGYRVLLAADGNQAVEIYKKDIHDIDLVLLDVIMPVLGGKEVFQELKKIDSHIKVLLFSGFSRDERINEILSEGALGFIEKPFTRKKLSAAVSKVLMGGIKENSSLSARDSREEGKVAIMP